MQKIKDVRYLISSGHGGCTVKDGGIVYYTKDNKIFKATGVVETEETDNE